MTNARRVLRFVVPAALLVSCSTVCHAQDFSSSGSSPFGFTPRVPISALAQPASWFDPSRFHLSTSVTVGSGFSGGTEGLQVTSLNYQFKAPVWMSVSVGNAFGPSARGNSSMFLQGLDLGVKPMTNMQLQVHYRNFRSPLQYDSLIRPFGWGE